MTQGSLRLPRRSSNSINGHVYENYRELVKAWKLHQRYNVFLHQLFEIFFLCWRFFNSCGIVLKFLLYSLIESSVNIIFCVYTFSGFILFIFIFFHFEFIFLSATYDGSRVILLIPTSQYNVSTMSSEFWNFPLKKQERNCFIATITSE